MGNKYVLLTRVRKCTLHYVRFILRNGLLQKHVTITKSEIPKMDPVGELTCYILDRKTVLCLADYFSKREFNSSLTLLSCVFLYLRLSSSEKY